MKQRMQVYLVTLGAVALLSAAGGCRDDAGLGPPPPAVALAPDSAELVVGQVLQVLVLAAPDVRGDVVLTSSDPEIAAMQPPATVTAAKAGRALATTIVQRCSRQNFDAFRDYVVTIPEVIDVYHVSGEIDFLVHVVAQDAQHLRDLALDRFLSRPEVGHIETELIFDHVRPPAHA